MEINGKVVKVTKYGPNEIVATVLTVGGPPIEIVAEEVIAAFGAGPERQVDAPIKNGMGTGCDRSENVSSARRAYRSVWRFSLAAASLSWVRWGFAEGSP